MSTMSKKEDFINTMWGIFFCVFAVIITGGLIIIPAGIYFIYKGINTYYLKRKEEQLKQICTATLDLSRPKKIFSTQIPVPVSMTFNEPPKFLAKFAKERVHVFKLEELQNIVNNHECPNCRVKYQVGQLVCENCGVSLQYWKNYVEPEECMNE